MKLNKIIFYINFMFVILNLETDIKSKNIQINNKKLSNNNENINLSNQTLYNITIFDYFVYYNKFYLLSYPIPDTDIGSSMLLDLRINKTNEFYNFQIEDVKFLAKKEFNCDLDLVQYSFFFDNLTEYDIISIKIKNITIFTKKENSKININIKKDVYFVHSTVCPEEQSYNITDYYYIDVLDYSFNNNSELYLSVYSNTEIPNSFTLIIMIKLNYQIIDYNFVSKPTTKYINVSAKMINIGLTNETYDFYVNFDEQFNINQTYGNYFVAYIENISTDKNENNLTYNIYIYSHEIYVGDFYNSFIPHKYNNNLGINHYKGLSAGILIAIAIGVFLILIILTIVVFFYSKKYIEKKNEDDENAKKTNKTNISEKDIIPTN